MEYNDVSPAILTTTTALHADQHMGTSIATANLPNPPVRVINIPGLRSYQQAHFSNVQVLTTYHNVRHNLRTKQEQERRKKRTAFL
jgi:hypothetical protein